MKINPKLKWIALLLFSVLLLQSCRTYQSRSVSIEDAILIPKKVKLKTNTNRTFKFENIQKEDGLLIGIAKRKSKTATELRNKIITKDPNSKFVKILLTENFISEVHLENKTGSIIGTVFGIAGLSILIAIGLLMVIFG